MERGGKSLLAQCQMTNIQKKSSATFLKRNFTNKREWKKMSFKECSHSVAHSNAVYHMLYLQCVWFMLWPINFLCEKEFYFFHSFPSKRKKKLHTHSHTHGDSCFVLLHASESCVFFSIFLRKTHDKLSLV